MTMNDASLTIRESRIAWARLGVIFSATEDESEKMDIPTDKELLIKTVYAISQDRNFAACARTWLSRFGLKMNIHCSRDGLGQLSSDELLFVAFLMKDLLYPSARKTYQDALSVLSFLGYEPSIIKSAQVYLRSFIVTYAFFLPIRIKRSILNRQVRINSRMMTNKDKAEEYARALFFGRPDPFFASFGLMIPKIGLAPHKVVAETGRNEK